MAAASGMTAESKDEQDLSSGGQASFGEEADDATGAASPADLAYALRMAAEAMRSSMKLQ